MNQISFTIKEAAQFLFPNRKGKGGELALRRLCKEGQLECLKLGSNSLISRANLLSFEVEFDDASEMDLDATETK